MTMFNRIKILYEAEGHSKQSFEKQMGFSNNSIVEGKAIRSDRLLAIANHFNVSTDWLITGEDPKGLTLTLKEQNLIASFRQLNNEGQALVEAQIKAFVTSGLYNLTKQHNSVTEEEI